MTLWESPDVQWGEESSAGQAPPGRGMGILGIFCGESAAQGIANQAKINDTIVPSLFHAQPWKSLLSSDKNGKNLNPISDM